MKRVKAACICQTLHFMTKEEEQPENAIRWVRQEVEQYKKGLERNHTKYRILEETEHDSQGHQAVQHQPGGGLSELIPPRRGRSRKMEFRPGDGPTRPLRSGALFSSYG